MDFYNTNSKEKDQELRAAAAEFEKTDEHVALVTKLSKDLDSWLFDLHANVVC